jgi:hypothetical protein
VLRGSPLLNDPCIPHPSRPSTGPAATVSSRTPAAGPQPGPVGADTSQHQPDRRATNPAPSSSDYADLIKPADAGLAILRPRHLLPNPADCCSNPTCGRADET